jgi:heat shock protein HslJ
MSIFQPNKISIKIALLLFSSMVLIPRNQIVSAREHLGNNFRQAKIEEEHNRPRLLASKAKTLEDSLWYLTSYSTTTGETIAAKIYVNNPQLRFSEGRVSGNSTCNRFLGTYSLKSNNLSIKPEITTLMSCPDEFMAQEQRFLQAMEQVSSYEITDNQLQLLDKDQKILLSFELTMSPALTNTLWQLIAYNNGQGGVVSVIADTNITATFDANGGLTGFAGCNNYLAGYTLTEDTLNISSVVSTRKFCGQPEGTMSQESAYLQALETTSTFSIDDKILTLRTDSGEIVAKFKAIDISD